MSTEEIDIEDEFDPVAVIMLIRWLQNVRAPDGSTHTLDKIAQDALGVSRHVLNRFLQQKLNRGDDETLRAREYAKKMRHLLDQGRPHPPAVRKLYKSVYGDADVLDLAENKPVQNPAVLRHRSMAEVPERRADITPLIGLSALVRTSNEYVAPTEPDEEGVQPGWSISILNAPPDHVQRGFNHPLFVLRQRGLNRSGVTIEGVVITQDDRFIFQGVDTISSRPFHAYLPIGEAWQDYRSTTIDKPTFGSGVMMGLSSERGPFAGLFDIFAIPGTVVGSDATNIAKEGFRERYREIIQENTGVRNLTETVTVLEKLGIGGGTDWLKDTLRDMRDRARNRLLLKP